jgi:hypothetical protein
MTPARIGLWLLWPAALVALGMAVEKTRLFEDTRFAVHRDPDLMPSTRAVPGRYLVTGQPILSVVTSEGDLHDPTRGILVHPTGRGREWERFAYVSYFDEGRLRFASGAGLRVHGGRSRVGSTNKSFGLFFRARYGAAPDAQLFFGKPPGKLARVIAHNDVRHDSSGRAWHFVNPLAYEVAARIGAIVPRTRPMRFFLNGELQGAYVLTEHIGSEFLDARFGHHDFGDETANAEAVLNWALGVTPMTVETVRDRVDLDNLTRWALSILFCGTTDIWQGPVLRDQRRPDSRWFWVNWDMDHSFMDLYRRAARPWEIDTYRSLLGKMSQPRSHILTRLLEGDPAFRARFASMLIESLNHRLTPEFLRSRLDDYRLMAAKHGVEETEFLDIIEAFFEHRPSALRSLTRTYLRLGEPSAATVEIPGGWSLLIDGYRVTGRYRGVYFPETPITVEVPAEHRQAFSGWTVDGAPSASGWRLTLPLKAGTSIAPRFRN